MPRATREQKTVGRGGDEEVSSPPRPTLSGSIRVIHFFGFGAWQKPRRIRNAVACSTSSLLNSDRHAGWFCRPIRSGGYGALARLLPAVVTEVSCTALRTASDASKRRSTLIRSSRLDMFLVALPGRLDPSEPTRLRPGVNTFAPSTCADAARINPSAEDRQTSGPRPRLLRRRNQRLLSTILRRTHNPVGNPHTHVPSFSQTPDLHIACASAR